MSEMISPESPPSIINYQLSIINSKKLLAFLGLCRRAGFLTAGFKAAVDDINAGKSKTVLSGQDISPKTFKEISFFAAKKGIPVFRLDINSDALSAATGTKAGVFSVNDEGFAKKMEIHLTQGATGL